MTRNLDIEAIATWCTEGQEIHPENQRLLELKTEIEAKKTQQPSVKKADIETNVAPLNINVISEGKQVPLSEKLQSAKPRYCQKSREQKERRRSVSHPW